MNNNEEKMTQLLIYPYDAFLMIRLEFIMVCQDELEAKLLRIIEKYIDSERKRIYRETINKSGPPPHGEVLAITEDIWVPISHKLFKNDLYGTVASENTLKKALKSMADKKIIFRRHTQKQRYDAPEYKIHVNVLQTLIDVVGVPGGQKLIPSIVDALKKLPPHEMTLSECQKLIPSSLSRGSKNDPNIREITDNSNVITEESNSDDTESHTIVPPIVGTSPSDFPSEQEPDLEDDDLDPTEKMPTVRIAPTAPDSDATTQQGDDHGTTDFNRGDNLPALGSPGRRDTRHAERHSRGTGGYTGGTAQDTPPALGDDHVDRDTGHSGRDSVHPASGVVGPAAGHQDRRLASPGAGQGMEAAKETQKAPIAKAQHDHSAPELPARAPAEVASDAPPRVSGVPSQQQTLMAPAEAKASARKKPAAPKPEPEDAALQARCSEWYARITEHCGGPMTKGGQVINEHKSVKSLCQKYTDQQIEAIFSYLTTRHWKWSKIDNKYNVRAFVLWDEAASVGQVLKEERETGQTGNGAPREVRRFSSFDDPNYSCVNEFYPTEAERARLYAASIQ